MPPPPLPLLCSSALVLLLLLLGRPQGANGRAAPPAGQPVQQPAPAVNGSVASAGLPAAAAPPPLGRLDQSLTVFFLFNGVLCVLAVLFLWGLDSRLAVYRVAIFFLLVGNSIILSWIKIALLEWWGKVLWDPNLFQV